MTADGSLDTPTRLLDVAERLIAERGVDAVSLRQITAAADANVAAVHYHFGSKRDLVQAVLQRRIGLLARDRVDRLAALTSEPTVHELVEAAVLPFLELARTADGASWAGFLAALERAGSPWAEISDEAMEPHWRPIADRFHDALPALSADDLEFRLRALGAVLMGPALQSGAPEPGVVVDLAAALLVAEVRAPAAT